MQASLVATVHEASRTRPVDIVLVIDDSASMHDQLELMAANLPAFGDVLEAEDLRLDARVAITTTSVPGPTCSGARARGGELVTDTCRAAPPEAFVASAELDGASLDLAQLCPSVCDLDSLDLRLSPADDYGEGLAIRPWIDLGRNSYGGNLPEGVSAGEALTCVGLRGIGGCEFESPAAAAARALARMQTPGDPAHGFLRDDVPLLIVFIGDEDDCSHPDDATIFDPDGERVFWSDPGAAAPTSAVCHNASTSCDADGCVVVDRDASGTETADPSRAVLRPLTELQAELDVLAEDREVHVALLGGVAPSGALTWPASDDDAWIDAFGWGPGCESPSGDRAQPPARLRELVDPEASAFSICNDDWTPVFESVAGWTGETIQLNCGPSGVRDLDPETALLEPDCEVLIRDARGAVEALPECVREDGAYVIDPTLHDYLTPDGAERCYVIRTDAEQLSPDPSDDLDAACVDWGHDTQLVIAAQPEALPPPRGSTYELVCVPG